MPGDNLVFPAASDYAAAVANKQLDIPSVTEVANAITIPALENSSPTPGEPYPVGDPRHPGSTYVPNPYIPVRNGAVDTRLSSQEQTKLPVPARERPIDPNHDPDTGQPTFFIHVCGGKIVGKSIELERLESATGRFTQWDPVKRIVYLPKFPSEPQQWRLCSVYGS